VNRHLSEIEVHARYLRDRALAEAAGDRLVSQAIAHRPASSRAFAAWLCRAAGRRLIRLGERLAGSIATPAPSPDPSPRAASVAALDAWDSAIA